MADLRVETLGASTVRLAWTAPWDDGRAGRAAAYEIRYTRPDEPHLPGVTLPGTLTPGAAGSPETLVVRELPPSTRLSFTLTGIDYSGNRSVPSNPGLATTPSRAPAPVFDLRVAHTTDSSVVLTWTATGADGHIGRADRYVVRWSFTGLDPRLFDTYPGVIHPAAADADSSETLGVAPLPAGVDLWVALKALDEEGWVSPISNVVQARTEFAPPLPEAGPPRLQAIGPPGPPPCVFRWRAGNAGPAERSLRIHDTSGRRLREIPLGIEAAGSAVWDGRDDAGRPLPHGLYFVTLQGRGTEARTRVVLLR